MPKIVTRSPLATAMLGRKIARTLQGGEILALKGDLGSGKTQFVKGLAVGLGVKKNINSPTFVLLKSYKIKNGNLIHIDCYRLASNYELMDLGWQEIIYNNRNIIAVEWAEKVRSILPARAKWIKFKIGRQKKFRYISL